MNKICVGMALLFCFLFSSSCATSQQGKIQTSTNNHLQNKKADKAANKEDGQDVPQDFTKALKLYRKAAEQGEINAQYSLGTIYYVGKDVPQDYAEAFKWYRKAAEQGLADAQFFLGAMYYNGEVILL